MYSQMSFDISNLLRKIDRDVAAGAVPYGEWSPDEALEVHEVNDWNDILRSQIRTTNWILRSGGELAVAEPSESESPFTKQLSSLIREFDDLRQRLTSAEREIADLKNRIPVEDKLVQAAIFQAPRLKEAEERDADDKNLNAISLLKSWLDEANDVEIAEQERDLAALKSSIDKNRASSRKLYP